MTQYTSPDNIPVTEITDIIASSTENLRLRMNAIANAAQQGLNRVDQEAIDGDAATLQAAKDDATSKANGAKWDRGVWAADLNTIPKESGRWAVNITTLANLPAALAGSVVFYWNGASGVMEYITREVTPRVFRRHYVSGGFGAWSTVRSFDGGVSSNWDTLTTPGVYGNWTALNAPFTGTWTVLVGRTPNSSNVVQIAWNWEEPGIMAVRRLNGTTWSVWVIAPTKNDLAANLQEAKEYADSVAGGTAPGTSLDVGVHQHLMRETDLRRRTGPISTGNKAAVSLVFDHGSINFRDVVLPMLRQYNMRATLALNSRMMDTTLPIAAAEIDDWATVAGWYHSDGIELANHTASHENASGYDDIYAEIIGGREQLETALNDVSTTDATIYVDSFVQSGTRTSTIPSGQTADAFDGFGDGIGLDKYYGYTAGRLIIDGHACVAGMVPHWGQLYPLDGHIQIGSNGRWLDSGQVGIDSVNELIDGAVASKKRCVVRAHPQYVGLGANYITAAQLDAFLASLAARRDAGDLVILPYREWNIATL